MIGRKKEKDILRRCVDSKRPGFVVIYGRRRVGKTYLVQEFFKERFSFYATGLASEKTRGQLKSFNDSLINYGAEEKTIPRDWFEAFTRLRKLLEAPRVHVDRSSGKKVVFLDELPWMDTARSDFRTALDYFWNGWGSRQKNLLLIVCGSATSWIIDHILGDHGGFYNRITRQIHLSPFTLGECEELFKINNISFTRRQQIVSYMVFGGIPYYLNLLDDRLSLDQNIDELLFVQDGALYHEFDNLFSSLFKNSTKHVAVMHALSEKKRGLTRVEIIEHTDISDGSSMTRVLSELEQCGFIRKYKNHSTQKNGHFYQIIDPFVLFCQRFIQDRKFDSWIDFIRSPEYYSWCGLSFEIVCLNHIRQIKETLGISGIGSLEYTWHSKQKSGGAQIDLLIDRRDDVINICEMKFSEDEYEIDAACEKQLINKVDIFRNETETKKALIITLISAAGLKRNSHANTVQRVITGDDLFRV